MNAKALLQGRGTLSVSTTKQAQGSSEAEGLHTQHSHTCTPRQSLYTQHTHTDLNRGPEYPHTCTCTDVYMHILHICHTYAYIHILCACGTEVHMHMCK